MPPKRHKAKAKTPVATAGRPAPAAAARRPAPRRWAPELPSEVLHAILLPLAGDIGTLCSAACVSTSWHAAALHPRLWNKLDLHPPLYEITPGLKAWTESKKGQHLTDERLAMLVRRACGLDADGNAHKLLSLRATIKSYEVTLRGVLAALRGPRSAGGKMLLHGALRTLHVSGLKHRFSKSDDKLVAALCKFVRPAADGSARPNLDVFGGITPCTRQLDDGTVCGRVASTLEHACEECDVALCAGCCRYGEYTVCEHMCGNCGRCCDADELELCLSCDAKSHRALFCSACMWHCKADGCTQEAVYCLNCADFVDEYVWCSSCGHRGACCDDCAFDGGHMAMCIKLDGRRKVAGCADCFCPNCAGKKLTTFWENEDDDHSACWDLCHHCSHAVDPSAVELRNRARVHHSYSYSRSPSPSDDDDDDE
jgi:hypothetical protein